MTVTQIMKKILQPRNFFFIAAIKENKMKQLILVCTILMSGFVNASLAQDIAGKWTGTMEGRDGPFDIVCSFKAIADTLTGTVKLPMGEIPISNGRVKGGAFSFDVIFGGRAINHTCTLVADSISMKYLGMEGKMREIILKRVAEAKQ